MQLETKNSLKKPERFNWFPTNESFLAVNAFKKSYSEAMGGVKISTNDAINYMLTHSFNAAIEDISNRFSKNSGK